MGDSSAIDIDDAFWQSKFPQDREWYGRECLVDLYPLDVTEAPARALQRLPNGRHRTDACANVGHQRRNSVYALIVMECIYTLVALQKNLRCWSMQAADSDRVMNMAYGWSCTRKPPARSIIESD
jgi:hypothetical protein